MITKQEFKDLQNNFNQNETALLFGLRFCKKFKIKDDKLFYEVDNSKAKDYIKYHYIKNN